MSREADEALRAWADKTPALAAIKGGGDKPGSAQGAKKKAGGKEGAKGAKGGKGKKKG